MKNESKFYHEIKRILIKLVGLDLKILSYLGLLIYWAIMIIAPFSPVELKVARGNKITFSPHQIAYHFKHPKNNFICVKGQDPRRPKLFEGSKIHELFKRGL